VSATPAAGAATYGAEWSASLRLGSDAELRGWVEAALGWCDAADAIALRHFRHGATVTRKPDRTFVTEADKAIERLVRERIADAFPGHGVLGEEEGDASAGASVRWYLDPIDGTHNYLRGVPLFATLLAAERDGELQVAVVSAPAIRTRWYGWRGGGTWAQEASRNGVGGEPRRVGVSQIAAIDEAQVVYAGTIDVEDSGLAPGFRDLRTRAWRERGFGDFWGHLLVAEGAAEAMIEIDLSPWDYAAPKLLVEESGGRVTDFDGSRALDGRTFLATNGIIHETVRAILAGGTER
jgi:histidinol-phosphatase